MALIRFFQQHAYVHPTPDRVYECHIQRTWQALSLHTNPDIVNKVSRNISIRLKLSPCVLVSYSNASSWRVLAVTRTDLRGPGRRAREAREGEANRDYFVEEAEEGDRRRSGQGQVSRHARRDDRK